MTTVIRTTNFTANRQPGGPHDSTALTMQPKGPIPPAGPPQRRNGTDGHGGDGGHAHSSRPRLRHGTRRRGGDPEWHVRHGPDSDPLAAHRIDLLLRSLALDRGPRAVAVILSGAGTDGMAGVKEVKAANGMVLALEDITEDAS